MATLFEIDKAIEDFEFDIDEETGEILNYDELDDLKMAREQKCENVALLIKNKEAEMNAVAEQEKTFASRKKSLVNEIDRLKDYLAYALGGEKFKTDRVVVSYRKSESVKIDDDYAIPDKWCELSVLKKPNKKLIKEALKKGEHIAGAELIEKNNINIK